MTQTTNDTLLLSSLKFISQKEYWSQKLPRDIPGTKLIFDQPLKQSASKEAGKMEIALSQQLNDRLLKLCKKSHLSLYIILLAGLKTLIFRYTEASDISIVSPPYIPNISEYTINDFLLLHDSVDADMTFKQLLMNVRETVLDAYENQDYPFEKLLEYFSSPGDMKDIRYITDILFRLTHFHTQSDFDAVQQKIVFIFGMEDDAIKGEILFDRQTYPAHAIASVLTHYLAILENAVCHIDEKISRIPYLREDEKKHLIFELNDTSASFPTHKTISELFEEQVHKHPHTIAVQYQEQQVTFKELHRESVCLAEILREKGIGPDSVVALLLNRSPRMMTAIMGVLEAGGAYLPIAPDLPPKRINSIIKDAGASLLIADTAPSFTVPLQTILFDTITGTLARESRGELEPLNKPADLAYIISTSGSSGRPKGIMIEHRNVVNLVYGLNKNIYQKYIPHDTTPGIRVGLISPYVFDASVKQIFAAVLLGHRLCITPESTRLDAWSLLEYYRRYNIDVSDGTPTHLRLLAQALKDDTRALGVKHFIIGGEALDPSVAGDFFTAAQTSSPVITNAYGPTECCVDATTYDVSPENIRPGFKIPIGPPMPNVRVYIMGTDLRLKPVGVPGELCIAGDGVGRGYVNAPRLTQEKFVPDPFRPRETMYRSGDIARWLTNGNIEFIGRSDRQVKVRGFRIEPGEIEQKLLDCPAVKEAVVTARENQEGDKYLCAYFVPAQIPVEEETGGSTPLDNDARNRDISFLKSFLAEEFPQHMLPSYFVPLERMPLTGNGKIDRHSLPAPAIITGKEYVAPRCPVEKKVVDIWADILNLDKEKIGIHSNFFEIGGNSLYATILAARVHKELKIKITLAEIFEAPTAEAMARSIKAAPDYAFSAVEPVEKKEYYPLSSAQKRIYIAHHENLNGIAYNMPQYISLRDEPDMEKLSAAFHRLFERNESLRTSFPMHAKEPVQRVHDIEDIVFEIEFYQQLSAQLSDGEEKSLHETSIITNFVRPFELTNAPLLRARLLKTVDRQCILMMDIHHIIADGISLELLAHQFTALYENQKLPHNPIQYKDYAQWQNNWYQSAEMNEQEAYWLQYTAGITPIELPVDYPGLPSPEAEAQTHRFQIEPQKAQRLKDRALEENATLYMVLLSIYNIFLAKISNREDIIVGTPVAGRWHSDLQPIIGMFINMLLLRNSPTSPSTYPEFLNHVKQNTLEAFKNQGYPYEYLVEKISPAGKGQGSSLLAAVFSYHTDQSTTQNPAQKNSQLNAALDRLGNTTAKFDLVLHALEKKDRLLLTFEYNTQLFTQETIERFSDFIQQIVTAVTSHPGNNGPTIAGIDIISIEEKNKLLYRFNHTGANYPREKTIHQLFQEQAARTPEREAVVFEDPGTGIRSTITYRNLNEKAASLAGILNRSGIVPETIVAMQLNPSIEMITGILSILKTGGAYLPIDPEYPPHRVDYILEDSAAQWMLTAHSCTGSQTAGYSHNIIYIDDPVIGNAPVPASPPPAPAPRNLAYIIYTSGSTGQPKGVMIEHRNIVRLLFNDKFQFDFNPGDTWTMFHSYCFDFSVWEMYGALLYGGRLVIIPKIIAKDTRRFREKIKREKVTVLNQTPSAFYNLINEEMKHSVPGLELRYIIFGGEALKPAKLREWSRRYPRTKLVNMYGITETTVHVTYKEIGPQEMDTGTGNIGKPIPTLRTYVLDKHLKPVPIGLTGELFVAGDGLGRGYLNRPGLSVERFIDNPYQAGEKLYRSGDLVKTTPDGEMIYIGRNDSQVKISGFRIELGEIEMHLTAHPEITDALVLALDTSTGSSEKYLCAYIVSQRAFQIIELREHLQEKLPDYMVPSGFQFLDQLPLTPNGKIDKKALIDIRKKTSGTRGENMPSRDQLDENVMEIWAEILNIHIDSFDIDTNFFELGGNSLSATVLTARIHKEFQVKISLMDIFNSPTVRELTQKIKDSTQYAFFSLEPAEQKEYYILSAAQRRMYISQQMDEEGTPYNMPNILDLDMELDKEKLEHTFHKIIKRHEALRTTFHINNSEPVQKIHENIDFKIEYFQADTKTLNQLDQTGTGYIENLIRAFVRPFRLDQGPLLRAGLIKTGTPQYKLMLDMHHIISDGLSMDILSREFIELYNGEELPPLTIHYKDFAEWQNRPMRWETLKRQENYWLKRFAGEIPILNLPTDFPRPTIKNFDGDGLNFAIGIDDTQILKEWASQGKTTLFMLLLAIFNVFLAKLCSQETITVGTGVMGRRHTQLESVIGMFINMLPLKNHPAEEKSFSGFLLELVENTLNDFENQDYQFQDLVDKVVKKRDPARNPLFDVLIILQNIQSPDTSTPPHNPQPTHTSHHNTSQENTTGGYSPETAALPTISLNRVSRFDLVLVGVDNGETLNFHFEYNTKLFRQETIERFIDYFKDIVSTVVTTPDIKLKDIKISHELADSESNIEAFNFEF